MPITASDVLTRVRDVLADTAGDRWSDAVLLRLLDEAVRDVATHAHLLRGRHLVLLSAGNPFHELPPDTYEATRFLRPDSTVLPVLSHEQADEFLSAGWETEVGSPPEAIIYNKLDRQHFRVYPIPAGCDEITVFVGGSDSVPTPPSVSDTYTDPPPQCDEGPAGCVGATAGAEALTSPNGIYGVMTDITGPHSLVDDFGVVADFDPASQDVAGWQLRDWCGVLTDLTLCGVTMIVYTQRRPERVVDVGQAIDLPEEAEAALRFYVLGMALRDFRDSTDKQLGQEYLQLYDRELTKLKRLSAHDYTAGLGQYEIPYTTPFNIGYW